MSNAEQYYIHSLLDPEDRIIVGNGKRYGQLINIPVTKPEPKLTEDQHNAIQDEYLKRHGIA